MFIGAICVSNLGDAVGAQSLIGELAPPINTIRFIIKTLGAASVTRRRPSAHSFPLDGCNIINAFMGCAGFVENCRTLHHIAQVNKKSLCP